jgi:hypothetical protein
MFLAPLLRHIDEDVFDQDMLAEESLVKHRNGQPVTAAARFNAVAVSPAVFVVLDIIVKDEKIRFIDLVEIAAPGDIGWLQNNTGCHDGSVSNMKIVVRGMSYGVMFEPDDFWGFLNRIAKPTA